ncbi:MAG: helix-turn-helix transcriptional regulator [Alistipes sp.]|nr:helix-turn-helix transcriptional regulator [Alistipes sp.]
MLLLNLDKTYFEENAPELLNNAGLNKAKFAEKMGVARQNIQKVFETKNVFTLMRAAEVLGVSLNHLILGNIQSETIINGYIEVNGTIHKVQSKQDLLNLIELL